MRRKDREITDKNEIAEIISRCRVMRLGMCDGGKPYIVPLNFGFDPSENTFFFHSAKEGTKLDIIRKNPFVFVELDNFLRLCEADEACDFSCIYESVTAEGTAEVLTDPSEKLRGLKLLMLQQTGREFDIPLSAADSVTVVKINISRMTAKAKRS